MTSTELLDFSFTGDQREPGKSSCSLCPLPACNPLPGAVCQARPPPPGMDKDEPRSTRGFGDRQVSHVRWRRCAGVHGARWYASTRRVRLAQPADYSEERPQWDGSLNATMLPRVWVERAGSASALLGGARQPSDLVDMPIDTVYMSMDMPVSCHAKLCSLATFLSCLLLSSLVC